MNITDLFFGVAPKTRVLVALAASVITSPLAAQAPPPATVVQVPAQLPAAGTPLVQTLVSDGMSEIADPKLEGGSVEIAFHMEPAGTHLQAKVEVLQGGAVIATPWSGSLYGGAVPTRVLWDGLDSNGNRCDTGTFSVRISGPSVTPLVFPLEILRLGITEIEAQDSGAGNNEWQMVYFRKDGTYSFYATPAIHEYCQGGDSLSASRLDENSGDPRAVPAVHTATDEPVLNGSAYETERYNYPLAYIRGTRPKLELTFGAYGTSSSGTVMSAGYPLTGREIRVVATSNGMDSYSAPITAGGTTIIGLAPLPSYVTRVDLVVEYHWQHRPQGAGNWIDIPGKTTVPMRFYTLLDEPQFRNGATGTQYTGPWVEVAEYISSWAGTLGITANDKVSLTEAHVKGFFGQNGGIPTAIEGVRYDCGPNGGDGGATHYFLFSSKTMRLSRLLNGHANGVFVNCSDNMGATTTMLAMMGVKDMRPVRLGNMALKAIWGIGSAAYTTNLWGGGHSFSYHHIVTSDDAVTVSDSCMQLDEDGSPGSVPGTPGWNNHRPWAGTLGYNSLSSYNSVYKNLEALPGVK